MELVANNFSIVMTQIYTIMQYLPDELLLKIPSQIQTNISSLKSDEYVFEYDEDKELADQDILEETKDMLAAIYLTYICNKERKNELLEICKKNDELAEQEAKEKYGSNVMFGRRDYVNDIEKIEETEMVEVKESFFTRLINKIKSFFKK